MGDLHITNRPPRVEGPGNGHTVVLVHGTMDRATSFTRMARELDDWTVLTYDRRGYASSFGRGASVRFADQIDDLIEVLDSHGPPAPSRVVAFGHSLGGAVVLGAMARQPDRFAGAVVYEAPASWEPWWAGRELMAADLDPADVAEGFMRQVVGDRVWDRLPEVTRTQRRAEGRTMMTEIEALGVERPFAPERIAVPVLVARGRQAQVRHVRSADSLVASLPGARLVIVEDADHGAHLSHAAEMAELIRECLALAG